MKHQLKHELPLLLKKIIIIIYYHPHMYESRDNSVIPWNHLLNCNNYQHAGSFSNRSIGHIIFYSVWIILLKIT